MVLLNGFFFDEFFRVGFSDANPGLCAGYRVALTYIFTESVRRTLLFWSPKEEAEKFWTVIKNIYEQVFFIIYFFYLFISMTGATKS